MTDRVSPADLDAERAILGAVLVDGDRLLDVGELLTPGDFFRTAHRTIYDALRGLSERRQPIDTLTLTHALGSHLADVGGAVYLHGLMDGVPRGSNVVEYCRIVRDKALRRRLQAAADQAIREAGDAEIDAGAALERAEAAIYELGEREQKGELRSASSVIIETRAALEKITERGQVSGVPSGFVDLDCDTRGFQPGNLIILAARPAMGKTAIALNIAHHAALAAGTTTALFSLEMSRTELMIRLLTAAGRLDAHRLMGGWCSDHEYAQLNTAMAEVGAADLYIDDSSSLTLASIRGKARRLKQQKGLGLVIIDYLQLLSSERRYESRVTEVGAMSRGLKQLAKELDVPVICLAQLNRAAEARKDGRPQLADLRESGSIEQDADVVLLLYRAEEYLDGDAKHAVAGDAELIIAKSRNGPTGVVKLSWNKQQTRFDNQK